MGPVDLARGIVDHHGLPVPLDGRTGTEDQTHLGRTADAFLVRRWRIRRRVWRLRIPGPVRSVSDEKRVMKSRDLRLSLRPDLRGNPVPDAQIAFQLLRCRHQGLLRYI